VCDFGRDFAGEPGGEVGEGLDADVGHVRAFEGFEDRECEWVFTGSGDVTDRAELVAEGFANGRGERKRGKSAEGSPESVNTYVLVEINGVVDRNAFEALVS
jgi:hypothetical protein